MDTKTYDNAVEHLLAAVERGGGTADRLAVLLSSLRRDVAGPALGQLMRNADAKNRTAILATLEGHARFGLHDRIAAGDW